MKCVIVAVVLLSCLGFSLAGNVAGNASQLHCDDKATGVPEAWIDMVDPCTKKLYNHVQQEINAAIQYMAMGAHFSRDTINRPGFANMFFESANEERQHAMKLISYLLMRGGLTDKIKDLINVDNIKPKQTEWTSGLEALKDALNLEAQVTKQIRSVITECEENNAEFNDYHLVDYLTSDFLEEQYKGERELAGKISTLHKMNEKHGALGEFLFDKRLSE